MAVFGLSGWPPHGGRRVGPRLRHALMHFISGGWWRVAGRLSAQIETLGWKIILRSRVSAIRSLVQVFLCRYRFRPAPVPEPEDPYLMPDQRRPETRRCATALNGKPETGMVAADIRPQPTIRFPSAAPFESCIFSLPPCQLANLPAIGVWPTGQLIKRSTRMPCLDQPSL